MLRSCIKGSAYLDSPTSSTCVHRHHHKMAKYVRNKRCTVIPSSALSAFVYQSISASLCPPTPRPPVSLRHQTANRKSWRGGSDWHQEVEMMEKEMRCYMARGLRYRFPRSQQQKPAAHSRREGRVKPPEVSLLHASVSLTHTQYIYHAQLLNYICSCKLKRLTWLVFVFF